MSSGSKGEIKITNDRNRPTAEQIQEMINDSVKHEEKDKQKRRRVEAINRLESLCNSVKNFLSDEKLACHFTKAEIQLMERLRLSSFKLIEGEKSGETTAAEFEAQSEELTGKIDPIFKRAK